MNAANSETAVSAGWSGEEETLLMASAESCRANGRPLREAFASFAIQTGRKPNSIRNHYYMMLKARGIAAAQGGRSFMPFDDAEVVALIRAFLMAQTTGESVRSCALRIGSGDNKAMLRYQNKYRSLLKKKPELVLKIVHELRKEGIPAINPYDRIKTPGSPNCESPGADGITGCVSRLVNELSDLDEVNAEIFFKSLGALASAACARRNTSGAAHKNHTECQGEPMRARLEHYEKIMGMFRRLVELNYDFINGNSAKKTSSLAAYIEELTFNVQECEKLIQALYEDGGRLV